MQYAASLTAIGVLSLSLIAAVAAQLSSPERMLQQPMWPTDMPLMLQLQDSPARPLELKTSVHSRHHHHEHRSPGKPGADVALAGPGIRTLALGETRELDLEIQSHLSQGSLHIRLEPSQDLQLVSITREWDFQLNGERSLALPIAVQALAEGQHYMHVFIEHTDPHGVGTTRALATEFRVGDGFLTNAYAKSFSMESRSDYRALPAREEIY
jgi:hypothetical protein